MPYQWPETFWKPQLRACTETVDAITRGYRRIVVTLPTGMGKTRCMSALTEWGSSEWWNTVLYTHRRMLLTQTSSVLTKHGIEHGLRASGYKPQLLKAVQLAMIQSERSAIKRHSRDLHKAQLVLSDELHACGGETLPMFHDIHYQAGASIVGFTATPIDLDGTWDKLITAGVTSEGRECGALVWAVTYCPDEPDLHHVKKYKIGEDLSESDNRKVMMRPGVFGRVFEHWARLQKRHWGVSLPKAMPTVLFAPDVAGSIYFAEEFTKKGVKAAHIDAKDIWYNGELIPSADENREMILSKFRDGEIQLLTNRWVLKEGIDLPNIAHCLDLDTEILTTTGWKRHDQIQGGDLLFNLNRDTGAMEVDSVLQVVHRPVRADEKMVHIESQHLNVRVTEDHHFWVKLGYPSRGQTQSCQEWHRLTGRELADRKRPFSLPLTAIPSDGVFWQGIPLTDDEIRFVAWYVTDGYIGKKSGEIEISQAKEYHHEIRALLTRIGFSFREYKATVKSGFKTGGIYYKFYIPMGRRKKLHGWHYLAAYLNKEGSPLWRMMTRRQFSVFWDELMKGDGQIHVGKTKMQHKALSINNKPLADLLHEMATSRGFAGGLHHYVTPNGWNMYALHIRDKQWISTNPSDPRATRITLEDPKPEESVWCVSTRNGTIVTRRRGKVCITGNCIFACAVTSVTSWLQMGGRAIRAYPGLTEVVIQDHGGGYTRPGLGSLNDDRVWELGQTAYKLQGMATERRRDGEDPEPIRCPQCGVMRDSGPTCPACGFKCHKRSRIVVQVNGNLKEVDGPRFRPRYVKLEPDTVDLWRSMYYRARSHKWDATFREAAAYFQHEHGYYPPADIPLMPTSPSDWFERVSKVPMDRLL